MSTRYQTTLLRAKYLLSRYGKLLVLALVLSSTVAFAGSALAYNSTPETERVTEQTDVQTFGTTVNTSAAVTGNTSLYESDRRLSDMPVYLLGASPNVTMIARTDVPDDRAVEVTQQITIELYATRSDEVFWTETRNLATDTERVSDGTLVTETEIDVQEIRRGRLSEVQSEVENVGTLHAKVHVDTAYKGENYEGRLTVTTPMEITDRAYAIDSPRSDKQSHATPVTRTVTESGEKITVGTPVVVNGTVQAGVLPDVEIGSVTVPRTSAALGGLGLLGLAAALVVLRVYGRLPDREELERAYDRSRFGEWISLGTVPEADAYDRVAIEGLTDLIDVAIDSDKRIIHDPERGLYAVIDGRVIYEYSEAVDRSGRSELLPGGGPGAGATRDRTQEGEDPGLNELLDAHWAEPKVEGADHGEGPTPDATADDGGVEVMSDGGVDDESTE